MTAAVVARLLVAADPVLAFHIEIATAGYRRALLAVGQQVPSDVDAFLAAVSDNGQFARFSSERAEDGAVGTATGLTPAEAAGVAGVSSRTVRRWLGRGQLPHNGNGRARLIPAPALVRYLEQRRSA